MRVKVIDDKRNYVSSYLLVDHLNSGETAHVYGAYCEGQQSHQADTVVKVAKESKFNGHIKREFDVLTEMHKIDPQAAMHLPSNIAFGTTNDGRSALIMKPILSQSLNQVFRQIDNSVERGKFALRAAKQYVELLNLIIRTGRSCQDKKLSDFWWVGHPLDGKLIVTDWNVIADSENQLLDIRRFGLLWYELIIGKELRKGIVLTRDDYDQIAVQPGYGLYYLIVRCIGTSIGPQFRTVSELSRFINELSLLYESTGLRLAHQATDDLGSLENKHNIDRSLADMAWIKFDLANLMGERGSQKLQNAKDWAKNPLEKYIPSLFESIKSPNFSGAKVSIDTLKMSAHGDQEQGDVERLIFIFDILNSVKTRHSLEIDEFGTLQKSLADIGRALLSQVKDIGTARKSIQFLLPLISKDVRLKESFDVLNREIEFWEKRYLMVEDTHPDYFIKLVELRQSIPYLPENYSPSIAALNDEKTAAVTRIKIESFSNEREKEVRSVDRTYRDNLPLFFDRGARWEETVLQITHLRMDDMGDPETKEDWQNVALSLKRENQRLAKDRMTPRNIEARGDIIKMLLFEAEKFPADFPDRSVIQDDYDKLNEIKETIRNAQQHFFKDRELVLQEAISGGYELFDSPELSVINLTTIFEIDQKFTQFDHQIHDLEKYKNLSSVLANNVEDLTEIKRKYLDWQKSIPDDSERFFLQALCLYLDSAYVLLYNGNNAENVLNHAKNLLDFLSGTHNNSRKYLRYKTVYDHLINIKEMRLDFRKLEEIKDEVENQFNSGVLNELFRNSRFDEIEQNLDKVLVPDERENWERILFDKTRFDGAKFAAENKLDYKEKKMRIDVLVKALNTLRDLAAKDTEIYIKYKDEFPDLCQRILMRLHQEDKKLAIQLEQEIGARDGH